MIPLLLRVKVSQEAFANTIPLAAQTQPPVGLLFYIWGCDETTEDLQKYSWCNKASMDPSIISIVDNVNLDRIVFGQKGTS